MALEPLATIFNHKVSREVAVFQRDFNIDKQFLDLTHLRENTFTKL
jgi:hypothetical protein